MIWKNKTLSTAGDIMDILVSSETKEEASEFVQTYAEQFPEIAIDNIKLGLAFIVGLERGNPERANELYEWLCYDTTVEEQLSLYQTSINTESEEN